MRRRTDLEEKHDPRGGRTIVNRHSSFREIPERGIDPETAIREGHYVTLLRMSQIVPKPVIQLERVVDRLPVGFDVLRAFAVTQSLPNRLSVAPKPTLH